MTVVPTFNTTIHAPHRLQICALLAEVNQAEFSVIRESVDVSESVLSKQLRTLEEAGLVTITKATRASRLRTWASLTSAGRKAYAAHVAELRRIVGEG
ncbi:transcriptional regulator [Antrihabitans cavernicola]|uniref:Helix-turn-helix domain-containing protein n=1 Tax=Antrihabitans cavernicola TaxID=2495913 RepID=A0A5A7SCK2_9NOCA|nr:transcriptional regulator [Spelaeibacter cavernicola]KAA0023878.1 helix-turn-helix domain-containing protein [Spelaeibacter cavernicola]